MQITSQIEKIFKRWVKNCLENAVRAYFVRNKRVKLIVVAGSVGKTSTKIAIATILGEKYRVRMEEKNYNSELSVPTAILGIDFPAEKLRSPIAWIRLIQTARRKAQKSDSVDFIIQEIGTEAIGEIPSFGRYLRPNLAVITAITPEHMAFFGGSLAAVAKEELAAANFSQKVLINSDDVQKIYLKKYLKNPNVEFYSDKISAKYHKNIHLIGNHSRRSIAAAIKIGQDYRLTDAEINAGVNKIKPLPGRMHLLDAIKNSKIIDDTFNSSPAAAAAALQTFYEMPAKHKVLVLGSMKELGQTSRIEHESLARQIDPKKVDELIVLHHDAIKYLAPVARKLRQKTIIMDDALRVGKYLKENLRPETLVLLKSSYGGIWLEEAIKPILKDPRDAKKLSRQFEPWITYKRKTFGRNWRP